MGWQYGLSGLLFEAAYLSYTYPTSGKIECCCNRPDDHGSRGSKEKKGAERTWYEDGEMRRLVKHSANCRRASHFEADRFFAIDRLDATTGKQLVLSHSPHRVKAGPESISLATIWKEVSRVG